MPQAPQGPLVSVIIPAHNAEATIEACLQGLEASSFQPLEVLVICDGCTDATERIAADHGVRVIRNVEQQGASYARNVGARAANGDVFFFVDADCVVQPDTLALGAAAFQEGAQVIFGSYTPETSAKGFLAQFKNYQHHYTHQQGQEIQTSFWSGCGAIRREAFERVAGFDVTLQACEDIEFGWALTKAGYQVRLVKAMQVEHLKVYSLAGLIRSDLRARAIPWTRLIRAGRSELGRLNTGRDGVCATAWTGAFWLSLAAAPVVPALASAAVLAVSAIAWHSRGLLQFVSGRRGSLFTLQSTAALVMHYTICGIGFVLAHVMAPYPRERAAVPSYRYVENEKSAVEPRAAVLKGS